MDAEEIKGKKIKYCNIADGVDCVEHNIICTEDNDIMFFNVTSDLRIKCYNEKQFKSCICTWSHIANELIRENIITEEELLSFKDELDNSRKIREDEEKQKRYEEYLKLKKEFE